MHILKKAWGGNIYGISGIKIMHYFQRIIKICTYGVHISELSKHGISKHDIKPYLPLKVDDVNTISSGFSPFF